MSSSHNPALEVKLDAKSICKDEKLHFITLSPSLQSLIIEGYAECDIEIKTTSAVTPHSNKGFKLFNNEQDLLPKIVHRHVAWGSEPVEVKKLVESHPYLLDDAIEVVDPAGRARRRTLYQRALAASDFEMAEMLQVLLIKYKGKYEEERQRTEQFPNKKWENEAKRKLEENTAELDKVIFAIREAKETNGLDTLKEECKPAITLFREYLESENNITKTMGTNTMGFDFDLQLLANAAKQLEKNIGDFGGWDSAKKDLYCQQVYGLIQSRVSARDANKIIHGLFYVVDHKEYAPRVLTCSTGISYFGKSSDGCSIGVSHFADIFGCTSKPRPECGNVDDLITNLYQEKISALLQFMHQPNEKTWQAGVN